MKVELSIEAGERLEGLIRAGLYPDAQSALDAALDALAAPPLAYTDAEIAAIADQSRRKSGESIDGWAVSSELRAIVHDRGSASA
jgi:hypothetical protein